MSAIGFLITFSLLAQDGKIIEQEAFALSDSARMRVEPNLRKKLDSVTFYRVTYMSDGLKIKAYMAAPKGGQKYPCIIVNRGGNRDYGSWTESSVGSMLGRYASWGYVVIASQYRGSKGSEGKDEFGGSDVNDVLNLFSVLGQVQNADTTRVGMFGGSRGGMMTYLAMKKTKRIKGAVIVSGVTDLLQTISTREQLDKNVYAALIPSYTQNKDKVLKERSAVYWPGELCKTTPLLIVHGSGDWNVSASQALVMSQKLFEVKHPFRFILFEGGDHALTEFKTELQQQVRRHFNHFVRDEKKWPSLEPHGY
jgi:dipeptidyl aminopeptidase/acylaminoacyl peptidase